MWLIQCFFQQGCLISPWLFSASLLTLGSQLSGAMASAEAILDLYQSGFFLFSFAFFSYLFCFCSVFPSLPTPPYSFSRSPGVAAEDKKGRRELTQMKKRSSDRRTDTLLLVSKHTASATSSVAEVAPRTFALLKNWFGFVFNCFSMPLSNSLESGGKQDHDF